MLALEQSLGVIAGLALWRDHADRKRVYYLPTAPRVARTVGGPELSYLEYRGDLANGETGGALLSFTAELTCSQAQLDEVVRELERRGVEGATLSMVPLVGGTAYLATALQGPNGFAEQVLDQVKPALFGSNRAVFAMRVPSAEGAALVKRLLTMEGPSPIGVRYELEYLGIRPALQVHLRADYRRIHDELGWGFEAGVGYANVGVRAGVEVATKKLVENGAIEIEVLHFTDSGQLHAQVDQALRWLEDRIIEDFFKSSLGPPTPADGLLEKVLAAAKQLGTDTLEQLMGNKETLAKVAESLGISPNVIRGLGGKEAAAGGGGSGTPFSLKVQFQYRDIHEDELKVMEFDWREAHAEKRTAAPQGLLANMGPPAEVKEVTGHDDYLRNLKVNVWPLGDFAALGVDRMIVNLAWPAVGDPVTQQSLVFERGAASPRIFGAWTEGASQDYRVQQEVHFRDDGPWAAQVPIYRSGWSTQSTRELALHPLSDVPRVDLEIGPGVLDFAQVPRVQVEVRVDGVMLATKTLAADQPRHQIQKRLVGSQAGLVEVRKTWFLPDGARTEGDWEAVEGSVHLVHGPWRSTRTVRVVPLVNEFIEGVVTLTLLEGTVERRTDVTFDEQNRRARSVTLLSILPEAPAVRVEVTIIRGDGSTFVGRPYETRDAVIVVRDRDGEHRQVTVRLIAGARLADHRVMAVRVQLLGEDDQEIEAVVFTESSRDPQVLVVPLADDGALRYRYRVTRYALDGTSKSEDVSGVSASEILVSAVGPI